MDIPYTENMHNKIIIKCNQLLMIMMMIIAPSISEIYKLSGIMS